MNKIRRFSASPPTRGPLSNVPGVSDIMHNMNVIKRLLSDVGDATRGKTPFNPRKLSETSGDEFVLGPVLTGIGGVTAAASAVSQYLTKIPAFISNRVTILALCGLLIGILQMAKNPIRGIVGKFNVNGFQDLIKKRAVFTYAAGSQNIFDVGTFEDYLKNPDILPKKIAPTLPQNASYDESLVGLTQDSAETLEKISIIVENVDRATMASLLSVAGLTIASGGVMKLIELSKGRDAADPKSRLESQEYLKQRSKSIGRKNN
jgi:hypothetical protein